MKIHKDKYDKAVKLLEGGYSFRYTAKTSRLSISQVNEIAKILRCYRDAEEEKKRLEKELKEKRTKLKKIDAEIFNLAQKKRLVKEEVRLAHKVLEEIVSHPIFQENIANPRAAELAKMEKAVKSLLDSMEFEKGN